MTTANSTQIIQVRKNDFFAHRNIVDLQHDDKSPTLIKVQGTKEGKQHYFTQGLSTDGLIKK